MDNNFKGLLIKLKVIKKQTIDQPAGTNDNICPIYVDETQSHSSIPADACNNVRPLKMQSLRGITYMCTILIVIRCLRSAV